MDAGSAVLDVVSSGANALLGGAGDVLGGGGDDELWASEGGGGGSGAEQEWNYDPSEPRCCVCNQVSYGDMVACDNTDVSGFNCRLLDGLGFILLFQCR